MKITNVFKHLTVLALVAAVFVGCASKQEQATGPDPAQVASEAISAAQSVVDEATAIGADATEAARLLADAKSAFDSGDYSTATDLANQAESAARDAIAQFNAQAEVEEVEVETSSFSSYEVVNGDNLWDIAGSSSIYGDPYQWPLIYKANKGQIKDADLIYPGQVFDIDNSPSSGDAENAINHAKSRGAWSVGAVEASDEAYLAQ